MIKVSVYTEPHVFSLNYDKGRWDNYGKMDAIDVEFLGKLNMLVATYQQCKEDLKAAVKAAEPTEI